MTEIIEAENSTPTVETPAPKIEEKKFTQAELDRVVKERLSREQATFKKSLEDYSKEKETLENSLKVYEQTLEKLLAPQMEQVPSEYRSLLEKLTTLEKLEWLASNIPTKAEKRKIPTTPTAEELPQNPKIKPMKKFI